MSYLRSSTLRSMRYNVAPRQIYGFGCLPLLLPCRREAHHMPGLQGTTACTTTTTTGTHEKEQTESLHMQASAGTHTNVPTAHQIRRRQRLSRLRRYVSSRLRMVTGTTEEKWTGEDDRVEEHSSRQRQTERKKDMPEHGGDGS